MDTPILSESVATADADLIKNTTTKDFMRDVIEASREVPVLVDFWAPWCGPCRQLTPVLEKAVRAAKGAVKLVKLNIDDHPQIPGQMGVQSIPAVFAAQVARAPQAVAVTFDGRSLTYRELDEAANRLAHLLAGRGVGPGECVALLLERSAEPDRLLVAAH